MSRPHLCIRYQPWCREGFGVLRIIQKKEINTVGSRWANLQSWSTALLKDWKWYSSVILPPYDSVRKFQCVERVKKKVSRRLCKSLRQSSKKGFAHPHIPSSMLKVMVTMRKKTHSWDKYEEILESNWKLNMEFFSTSTNFSNLRNDFDSSTEAFAVICVIRHVAWTS